MCKAMNFLEKKNRHLSYSIRAAVATHLHLVVCKTEKSKIKMPEELGSSEGPSSGHKGHLFAVCLHDRRGK